MHSDMGQAIRRMLWFMVFLLIGWAELVSAF